MLNVLGHYTPLLAKTRNRALVLARASVVELLQALVEWRPVRVEWLDRETRLDRIRDEGNSMANLAGVVQQLRKERDQAARTVEQLDAALAALDGDSYGRRTGARRKISAAGRAKIAAAQRARWAKVRRNGGQKHNIVSMPKKKTMSAAARKKIAAAQRARWAKVKAAQKRSA